MSSSQYKMYKLLPWGLIEDTSSAKINPGINPIMIPMFGKEIELKFNILSGYYECRDGWHWHKKWINNMPYLKAFDELIENIQCL